MKSNKGVTLVALVITIIVLLILAGVSISLVVGDNGVLTQSQKASKNTDKAGADSALQTTISGLQSEWYGNVWVNNVNAKFSGWLTYKKIYDSLDGQGYKLVTGYGAAKTPKNDDTALGTSQVPLYIASKNAKSASDTVYRVKVTVGDSSATINEHAKLTTGSSAVED